MNLFARISNIWNSSELPHAFRRFYPLALFAVAVISLLWYLGEESWILKHIYLIFTLSSAALLIEIFLPLLYGKRENRSKNHRISGIIWECIPPVVIMVVVSIVFRDIFKGEIPYSYDHPIQILNGWIMSDKLLATDRLSGWVHDRGLGFPAGTLYPQGAYYLMSFVKWILPADMSWDRVYAYSFLLSMFIWHNTVYGAGRLIKNRTTGLIAGLLAVVDPGAYFQGGNNFAVYWGVWPSCVAGGLCLFGAALFYRAISRNSVYSFISAAIVSGWAITFHPVALIYLMVSFGLATVHVIIVFAWEKPWKITLKAAALGAMTVGVAAVWLLPFLAYKEYSEPLQSGLADFEKLVANFLSLTFYPNMWALVFATSILGAILAYIERRPLMIFFVLLSAVFTLMSSSLISEHVWVPLELDTFIRRLQPSRFYLFIRPISLLAAGYAVSYLLDLYVRHDASRRPPGNRFPGWRNYANLLLTTSVFAVFVVPGVTEAFKKYVEPATHWSRLPDTWEDYRKVAAFLKEQPTPPLGIIRAMWDRRCNSNVHHCYEDSTVYSTVPQYFPAHHSGATFNGFFAPRSPQRPDSPVANLNTNLASRRMGNVKYIVTDRAAVPGAAKKIFSSGKLNVFVDDAVQADRPFAIEGGANARLVDFEDEYIAIDIEDVQPKSRLVLHVFEFCNWHAFLNGKEIPIKIYNKKTIKRLMRVDIPENGLLEFKYIHGTPERLSPWITFVTLLICIVIPFRRRISPAQIRKLVCRIAPKRSSHPDVNATDFPEATPPVQMGVPVRTTAGRPFHRNCRRMNPRRNRYTRSGRNCQHRHSICSRGHRPRRRRGAVRGAGRRGYWTSKGCI
ncbi:MAG: hypothetical protein JXR76_31810 [Deltaproteobacteria bacterium]|nr:hypothetical protein [Deltaproteobacteria bacterium]